MEWHEAIGTVSSWDLDAGEHSAKFDGSPAERIMDLLDAKTELPDKIEFSDNYNPDFEVWYEPRNNRWSWRSQWQGSTDYGEDSGSYSSYEWRKKLEDHLTEGSSK